MKKSIACLVSVTTILAILAGIFVYRNEFSNDSKRFDENNIGECYFQETSEEHIAKLDSEIMYADNEILVVAKENVKKKKIEKLANKYNAEIVGRIEQTGDYQWIMNETYSIEELEAIIVELENEDIVDSASINYISEISEFALPVNYGKEWSGETWDENDHAGSNWGLEAIHALSAWDILEEHQDKINPIRLGLIDSGFDTNHEDLVDCLVDTFYNTSPNDHGTHVAGIMASNSDNSQGICGVYPYGVFDGKGNLYAVADGGNAVNGGISVYSENGTFWTSVIAQKIGYAELILRNVRVINQSQGFNWYTNFEVDDGNGNTHIDYNAVLNFWNNNNFKCHEDLARILGYFFDRLLKKNYDFVIVSAAGNDSNSSIGHLESKYSSHINLIDKKDYPDVYNRIIVVGSIGTETNHSEALFDQTINISRGDSGYHISTFSNLGKRVDVVAPGEKIFSTLLGDKYGDKNDSGKDMSGTSMAAPHVAGVAAMVWAANNNLTGAEVKEIICSTANNLVSLPGSSYYKTDYKLVDAKSAVEKALGIEKEATTEPQNGGILCWVVNKANEDEKIPDATVTATNVDTGESYETKTDSSGHFELFLPEGKYNLTVTADDYKEYIWPDGNENFQNPIEVKNNGVNYLDDWIKMDKLDNTPKIVQAVLDNESIWLGKINSLITEHSDFRGQNECWFQDIDMDGTPEFIVGGATEGRGGYSSYYIFYYEDGQLKPMSDSIVFGTGALSADENRFALKLYRNNDDGSYGYISSEGAIFGTGQYDYALSKYSVSDKNGEKTFSSVDTGFLSLYMENSDITTYANINNERESVSNEEFLNKYHAFFDGITMCDMNTQTIPCTELSSNTDTRYESMPQEQKKQALLDSYNAWSYKENESAKLPLADIIKDIENTITEKNVSNDDVDKLVALAKSIHDTKEWGEYYVFSIITTADGIYLCADQNQGLGDSFWIYDVNGNEIYEGFGSNIHYDGKYYSVYYNASGDGSRYVDVKFPEEHSYYQEYCYIDGTYTIDTNAPCYKDGESISLDEFNEIYDLYLYGEHRRNDIGFVENGVTYFHDGGYEIISFTSNQRSTELNWQDAYASYIRNGEYTSLSTGFVDDYISYDKAKFHLIYLDNDSIPELLITGGYSVHIITFSDGKVTPIIAENEDSGFCWYGYFHYRPYSGYFVDSYERGGTYLTPIYQLTGNKADMCVNIEYFETISGDDVNRRFLVDGTEVSEEKYIQTCSNWNLSTYCYDCPTNNWEVLDLNQYGWSATEANIKSYIENN